MVVAHNRYWATDNVYATENGGLYNFVIENDTKRALPQDDIFWNDFFKGFRNIALRLSTILIIDFYQE